MNRDEQTQRPTASTCGRLGWSSVRDSGAGFSLIECIVVLALGATISAIAVPRFMDQRENMRIAAAITEVSAMSLDLQAFKEVNGRYPLTLSEAGLGGAVDPWGFAYGYLKIEGVSGNGGVKKDQFLVPLNTDYDLYSVGADGATHIRMTNASSQDDVVRALNGSFVGLSAEF